MRHLSNVQRVAVLTLAAAMPLAAATAFAQTPTFVRSDYPLATNDLIAADLNGDGRPDLAGLAAAGAAVLLGNGDGTFQPIVTYAVFSSSQALAAGDFNNDGRVDLMVTINDVNVGLSLLTGRGDGTFNPAVHFPNTAGFDAPAIAADDLDNDGKLDIVLGHSIACYTAPCVVARSITVMRGNGDGTFQPARHIAVGSSTAKIAIGDFNRDGIKDLGLASSAARVLLLLGVGDATFVQQPTITLLADSGFVDATDIDIADFNGDTMPDLVVAIALNGSRTAILIGNGDGTFRTPSIITEPQIRIPQYQAVGDYNGDGFQDLAMSLGFGSNGLMEIRNGNGDGTFGPLVLYLQPPPLSSIGGIHIVSSDFNNDGRPDIALNYGGASAGVVALRNTTGTAPPPPPATPPAPALVSPANQATVALPVTLDWSDVSAAASYQVQVDDSSTFSAPRVVEQTVTASQFTAASLAARQHWWRVRGVNSAGTAGTWSSTRSFTPQSAPVPGGQTATLTVTATGRSGQRITSSPTGINVAVGSNGSASFATGTSITLSVSNGRDAIWSGACSSGGSKRRTCTFTLTGNAAVSANVQ